MINEIHSKKWDFCLTLIRDNVGKERFDTFFKCAKALSYDDNENTLTIGLPSTFFYEKYEDEFSNLISAALRHVFGENAKLDYIVGVIGNDEKGTVHLKSSGQSKVISSKLNRSRQAPADPEATKGERDDIDPQLNASLSFDNYCLGESNRLAHTIAKHIAENPVNNDFNPFFLYGDVGVGKTHLIQAIGIKVKELFPQKKVLFTTARIFQHLYANAVLQHNVPNFINWFQQIDVLLLDDLQELSSKVKTTNDALFPIFNHLHQNGKQLVFTCDRPPMELDGIADRLIDRFKWGITEELPKPDKELRKKILTFKAQKNGLELSEEIIDLIAGRATSSVRELEGIVLGLYTRSIMSNKPISKELAYEVMRHSIKAPEIKPINFDMIVETTAEYFSVNPDVIFSKSRMRDIADARQVIMYLAHKLTNLSSKAIGAKLNREHTTVLHGISTITDRLPYIKELSDAVESIEQELSK